MIRHIVLWKLAAQDAQEKQRHLDLHAELLGHLPAVIPEARDLVVRPRAAYPGHNWDLALSVDFVDLDGLRAFLESPHHADAASRLRDLSVERAVIDIEI